MMFCLAACSNTIEQRQEGADQTVGDVKRSLVAASGLVDFYNLLRVCSDQNRPRCSATADGWRHPTKGREAACETLRTTMRSAIAGVEP